MDSDLVKIKEYVLKNKVPAKQGFICVDGRYPKGSEFEGMLARPGGNFKGILACLALKDKHGLTVGRCVDKGVAAIESMGLTFNMHTDQNSDPDNLEAIGCGHIAKAADPKHAKDYGVEAEDVKRALMYLRLKLEGRGYYKMVDLAGEHKEKGVLVVTGKNYTVNHYDPERGEMFFVYDKARDEEFGQKLFKKFELPGISLAEFKEIQDKQLQVTLGKLAQGLPIYEVDADLEDPAVKFVGTVL